MVDGIDYEGAQSPQENSLESHDSREHNNNKMPKRMNVHVTRSNTGQSTRLQANQVSAGAQVDEGMQTCMEEEDELDQMH